MPFPENVTFTFMHFLEKVLPEVEHQIRKQFLNELVPNYYFKNKFRVIRSCFTAFGEVPFDFPVVFSENEGEFFIYILPTITSLYHVVCI